MGRSENDNTPQIVGVPNISGNTAANGSETITISNVGPAGVGTATISKWLVVKNGGVDHYIPMWT